MEQNCKHNCNSSIANYWPRSAACKWKHSLALHAIKFVQITVSRKCNNLCAEFEALMGKILFIFILVTCAFPKTQIASSGMDIRRGYVSNRLGPLLFHRCRALHLWEFWISILNRFIKKIVNHSWATFRKLWSKSYFFQKEAKIMQRGQLSSVQLQNVTNVWSFCTYITLLNSVHKLKCETNLTLSST